MSLQDVSADGLPGVHGYGPLVLILVACAVVGAVGIAAAAQIDAMWTELQTHATDLGWTEVPRDEAPQEIVHLIQWRRPKRILRGPADGAPVWLVWHQWGTSSGKSRSSHSATRFLTAQPIDWPDFTVVRRTALGTKLMPVSGAGTGDREFDREYLIRTREPTDTPVMLTPDIRAAPESVKVFWTLSLLVVL